MDRADTSQTKKLKGEMSVRTYQDTYHMLNESQQKPKPRRQHIVPTRKRQDETNDVQTEIEKRKEKKKKWSKSTSTTQERRQHVRGTVSYTHLTLPTIYSV